MRRDDQLDFCTALSVAANSGQTTVLTDVIDTGALKTNTGAALTDRQGLSGRLYWNCIVDGEDMAAAADSAVVTFSLYADSDTTPTTGGTVILSKAVTVTQTSNHKDGTQLFSIPLPADACARYWGVAAAVATQNLSTGKVSCWIGPPLPQV